MFHLPAAIQSEIFEFDSTYREKYNEVMAELEMKARHIFEMSNSWNSYKGQWYFLSSFSFFFEENRVWELVMFPSELSWVDQAGEWVAMLFSEGDLVGDDDEHTIYDSDEDDEELMDYYNSLEEQTDDWVYALFGMA